MGDRAGASRSGSWVQRRPEMREETPAGVRDQSRGLLRAAGGSSLRRLIEARVPAVTRRVVWQLGDLLAAMRRASSRLLTQINDGWTVSGHDVPDAIQSQNFKKPASRPRGGVPT